MRKPRLSSVFALLAAALAIPPAASANESVHLLSLGAGVSSPSFTSALHQNPAGLIANTQLKLHGEAASSESDLDPKTVGGGIFYGKNSIGAGLTYNKHDLASDGSLAGGAGVGLRAVDIAFGVTGYADTRLKNKDLSAGMLLNSRRGDIVLGMSAYGVSGGVDAYGAGVTFRIEHGAYLSVDATANDRLKGKLIRPTIGIKSQSLALMVGYGFRGDKLADPYTPKGEVGGLGLEITRYIAIQVYYNQLAKYYGGLTIKF